MREKLDNGEYLQMILLNISTNTIGILIPNMYGTWMVDLISDFKWFHSKSPKKLIEIRLPTIFGKSFIELTPT